MITTQCNDHTVEAGYQDDAGEATISRLTGCPRKPTCCSLVSLRLFLTKRDTCKMETPPEMLKSHQLALIHGPV